MTNLSIYNSRKKEESQDNKENIKTELKESDSVKDEDTVKSEDLPVESKDIDNISSENMDLDDKE